MTDTCPHGTPLTEDCGKCREIVDQQKRTERMTYWQRLKDHPGLFQVAFWPVVGFWIAGRDDWHRGAIAAALALVLLGSTVLWTARK